MTTFGNRPEDVVTDAHGNVLTGIVLTYFASEANAQANTSPLGTVTTAAGRWSVSYGARVIWIRTPDGQVYPVASDTGAQTVFVSATDPALTQTVFDNDVWISL